MTVSKESDEDLPPLLSGTDYEPLNVAVGMDTSEERGSSALSTASQQAPNLSNSFAMMSTQTEVMTQEMHLRAYQEEYKYDRELWGSERATSIGFEAFAFILTALEGHQTKPT